MAFFERLASVPYLGLGISTEYGAIHSHGALDPCSYTQHPEYVAFLEVGVEVSRGLDQLACQWADQGLPTTYHFLDLNLDEPEDLEWRWVAEAQAIAARLKPAWFCGDAGLWHFGRRERGHMLLLPLYAPMRRPRPRPAGSYTCVRPRAMRCSRKIRLARFSSEI